MPISIKTDLEYGESWYIRNDPDQREMHLVGISIRQGGKEGKNQILFILDYMGDEFTVYDFQCSRTRDTEKYYSNHKDDDE